ncbi:MAG: hypothetical protein A2932_00385 [Candidatus Spechtbacteria bacterium RIFCSPLOWO2_01_FULL_46_10]|uniref:ZIP zinc transporter n=1 Tax=Candidatus Spechtbacteria bacterium RIFCSPLOWO2_01_FULL_46_10 TaxID=1802163 RepID=A0A1G2HHY4_9BACT|nr:MAG: hypothetical protein A2932_00385 [Candidatus Spechtbacteria bacterium RIFCSPLOWO2_01_FULL_46_10]
MLGYIILFSLLGSVGSMAGGVLLLWKEQHAQRAALFLISFAAGVLLSVGFLDLLPEALEKFSGDIHLVSITALLAMALVFVVERFLWWYHHHRFEAEEHHKEHHELHMLNRGQAYILLSGDALHNFIDGVLITAAFFVSFPLGISVSIGIIAHELPQEIADFSVMLNAGFKRLNIFLLNLSAALATLIGAMVSFFVLDFVEISIPYILATAFGVFTYIALSDLIPAIHHQSEHKYDILHFLFFTAGLAIFFLI